MKYFGEEKKFNEVFPTVKLPSDLAVYMDEVRVFKITKEGNARMLRVYTISNVLIPKDVMLKVEDILLKQLFRRLVRNVRILDRYILDDSFTPEIIYDSYKKSFELELNTYFHREYMLYKNSEIFFRDGRLHIIMGEGLLSEYNGESLKDYFKKLFNIRFGMATDVICDYKDNIKGKFNEEKNHELSIKISQIEKNIGKEKDFSEKEITNEKEKTYASEVQLQEESVPEKDPSLIYGREFEGETISINEIDETVSSVIISGMVCNADIRTTKNKKNLARIDITDFNDTITAIVFLKDDELADFEKEFCEKAIDKGIFIKLKGNAEYSRFEQEIIISRVSGIMRSGDIREFRNDNAYRKRVELSCHTKMSDMDGVASVGDIIAQAKRWGHKAIAITDSAVVQAFPECFKAVSGDDFQIIYGIEANIIDDERSPAVNEKGQKLSDTFVVFDLETTGFSAVHDRIIEIGAVKITNGEITERFSEFVNPEIPIPFKIEKLTSISNSMVADAKTIDDVLPRFLEFAADAVLVGHNVEFDVGFISCKANDIGRNTCFTSVDTVLMAQFLFPGLSNFKLDTVVKHLGVILSHHHRAVDDAEATAGIFLKMSDMLYDRDIFNLTDLNRHCKFSDDTIKKLHSYSATLLAMTEEGKNNLYRLVTKSHLDYFYRVPKIPKSLLNEHRKGLLVGSGNINGEIYQALLSGRRRELMEKLSDFYDYFEVQPVSNNTFLIDDDDSYISGTDDLIDLTKKIIEIADELKKLVVATGDVRFLNPSDSIYRAVLQNDKGIKTARNQPPLYFRTTEEMLSEFSFLGNEKAYELVVENPNRIRLMCEKICPVRPDKCPPVIKNSDNMLKEICYDRAHEIYGNDLPLMVSERLQRELDSIINNGYSVMYIIAQKLVWKSNDDGYIVGSRGSVGSSLAATMAGITEVNPLSPHYLCHKCHYVDFESETVKKHSGGAGCDMPDMKCPKCGTLLNKLGFDIPFETFLGFKGNKEPDIDLNFSNEYQSKAHAFTKVIFGEKQTFKAGTVGTVKKKIASGMVWKFYKEEAEEKGIVMTKRRGEIERIAKGCIDVRRTTGQHPGGIVVLPFGEEIDTFTPVQHPANDMKSDIITTHFDYHSIEHNLLKLDILGHLDPTMLKVLQDMTSVDPLKIPLDSKEVMSLFKDTSALKISSEDIDGVQLGTLGIPEFGTEFAMGMVTEAKPEKFSDLIRIAGLAHGENVWANNTQILIREGKATISTAICTRDDIMTYLISKGLDKEDSFTIMESVRKGKGLKPEWEEQMKNAGVPDWYIWSCKQIHYMFPKAHAAAYVMMAWRVAYFKIFYPLEFYCAYFSIRANGFDYEKMAMGRDRLRFFMNDLKKKHAQNQITDAEENELRDMRLVDEMYARGLEFMPIDIYRAKARNFQVIDKKIMPSFKVVDKIGEVAGENIEIAAANGKFLSKEDLMKKAKLGKTMIEKLEEIHVIDGLTDNNQISFTDLLN